MFTPISPRSRAAGSRNCGLRTISSHLANCKARPQALTEPARTRRVDGRHASTSLHVTPTSSTKAPISAGRPEHRFRMRDITGSIHEQK
eukprot:5744919-Pyramimonas_sp.AAC.1